VFLCVSGSYGNCSTLIAAELVFYILTIVSLFVLRVNGRMRRALQGMGIPGIAGALHRDGDVDLYRIIAIQPSNVPAW